ncbi:MAG: spore germination protein [Clostridia bacterium]|nr:spore germination protein [Clostridia bacterium]
MKTKLDYIKEMIQPSNDLVTKDFLFLDKIKISIVFLKNMPDMELLNSMIIKPLIKAKQDKNIKEKIKSFGEYLEKNKSKCNAKNKTQKTLSNKVKEFPKEEFPKKSLSNFLISELIFVCETEYVTNEEKMLDNVLRGNCLVLINDGVEGFICSIVGYQDRTITEPPTSVVINGPRAGFVENLNTNITLVRRRLCNSDFKIEEVTVGRYTKTRIAICYISTICDNEILKDIKEKISSIDIDGIIDSEYLVDYISKKPFSMFKQIGKSEKPDVVVSKLLEGRICIMVDGSPICLSVPFLFLEDIQAPDDYYQKNYKVIFLRFLRLTGIFFSLLLPGIYVAMQSFHYKLLPTKFLATLLNSTQGLPLTPFLEVLFVILLFEILYESSIRMPKYMGMALSIVGALILGDTAVKAGLISSPSVMIVAVSGLTIYIVPDESGQLSLLRIFFVLAGGTLGLFGILMGLIVLLTYVCQINNYNVPYLAPIAPLIKNDLKDTFGKATLSQMDFRPESLNQKNKKRLKNK